MISPPILLLDLNSTLHPNTILLGTHGLSQRKVYQNTKILILNHMIFYISKNSLLRCQVLTGKCNVFLNFQLANVTKQAPFGNIEALEDYAEKSVSSVYYLTLQCLGKYCTSCDGTIQWPFKVSFLLEETKKVARTHTLTHGEESGKYIRFYIFNLFWSIDFRYKRCAR